MATKLIKVVLEYEDGEIQEAKGTEAEKYAKNMFKLMEHLDDTGNPFVTDPIAWTLKKRKKKVKK